jgi:hypothetical protein
MGRLRAYVPRRSPRLVFCADESGLNLCALQPKLSRVGHGTGNKESLHPRFARLGMTGVVMVIG